MKNKIFSIILIALGTALIAVASQISFPIGTVPITLQTLAVGLIASLYHVKETFLTMLLYLLLGLIGLPIFAGGAGGFSVIYGPTGGFLVTFLISGTLISSLLSIFHKKIITLAIINMIGAILTLFLGTIWLKVFVNMNWSVAFLTGFIPFLADEILKVVLIVIITRALIRILPRINSYFE
ncbi:biotin transporter BioY [Lactovum miscens]|uniref:Biotin transporter n=1 Tax=Lactovum miscens TaxID=190387 RepID=A0A841CC95_9LACT|nr:biotin transporter BioY [Lactovum miscens]MBB5888770.1 biotin transport system substrate-specific component [Lactovum miscens]